jgi:hypothetical protein
MSKESMPVLSGAILSFEMFMSSWEELSEKNPRLQPLIKSGLDVACKYYVRMDWTLSYVLAMHTWT